jgi:Lrp/AsnC family transcriptional regulator, leucine-responsive regulatory protein
VSTRIRRQARPGTFDPSDRLRDDVNRRLLEELQAEPRISTAELGRRINLSAPAVAERLARLERAGVIAGYRVELDPAALGYPVAAFVRVRPAPGRLPKIAALAAEMDEVTECHRITGEDCFLLKVHVPSIDELDGVLDRLLAHGQTTTSIVQSTPVPRRSLPLWRQRG